MFLPCENGLGRILPKKNTKATSSGDVTPEDILKNLEDFGHGTANKEQSSYGTIGYYGTTEESNQPFVGSTLTLIKDLVGIYSKTDQEEFAVKDKAKRDAKLQQNKRLVYTTLLTHRKDYDDEKHSQVKVNEVEELIWMTYVLRQQRRFDDANTLTTSLQSLKENKHLEANSEVRSVLRFLVALAGSGQPVQKTIRAKLTPRVVSSAAKRPSFLPAGPLHYGDTFLYSSGHSRHYMHFPSELFSPDALDLVKEPTPVTPMSIDSMWSMCDAPPGTGISPLLLQENIFDMFGKAMGGMVQERSGELTPDTVLTLPELPSNPHGYCQFGHIPKSLPSPASSALGNDEGYASSRTSPLNDTEEEVMDIWEAVLQGPPLTARRTWENLGHPPTAKEKLFLSETGSETAHRVWMVYQQLWGSFGAAHRMPPLQVFPMETLCQHLLYLMVGIPSLSFPWCEGSKSFNILEGLCCPGITPEPMRSFVAPFIECGTFVRRLEVMCSPPAMYTRQMHIQGLVFRAFTAAVADFLQIYRSMVLSLVGETNLLQLQNKTQSLIKKVRFIAHVCHIRSNTKHNSTKATKVQPQSSESEKSSRTPLSKGNKTVPSMEVQTSIEKLPRGLSLIGELYSQLMVTKDRDCALLLVSILKTTCVPFFRFLEKWVYEGLCSDPGLEFMIDVDGRSLLQRNRRYWTHGYTLHDLSDVPPFLHEVLQEAYTCGKAINLLKLCSPKHHLVMAGGMKHPSLQLCITAAEMDMMRNQCENYTAHMDYLAAKNQVTAHQYEEQQREEKKLLLATSAREQAAALAAIERKMNDRRQLSVEKQRARFLELKEEMEKAVDRKKEEKEKEIEENMKFAVEAEQVEKEKHQREEKLRNEMELYYQKLISEAEQRERLFKWKMQRCQLNETRKHFISSYKWLPLPETEEGETLENEQDNSTVPSEYALPIQPKLSPQQNITSPQDNQLSPNQFSNDHIEPSPTSESVSAYDMTASLMSTSSDILDTPHDENLPEFEVDPAKSSSYDRGSTDSRSSRGWTKSSIGSIIHSADMQMPVRNRLPTVCEMRQVEASVTKKKGLEGEFSLITQVPDEEQGDGNANFVSPESVASPEVKNDENGNSGAEKAQDLVNANLAAGVSPDIATTLQDLNANSQEDGAIGIMQTVAAIQECMPKEKTNIILEREDESNGNVISNMNEAFSRYRETFSEAEKIKKRVLEEEYHSSTTNRNTMNIMKSKAVTSSEAMENKKRILESEFGVSTETSRGSRASVVYDRQISGTSTSSFKSCVSYDRLTSSSTAFNTPEEERPVLIDQVGGEVLRERGRSIYGHASDAVIHKLLWRHVPAVSPTSPLTDTDLLSARRLSVISKIQPYSLDYLKLMGEAPLLTITGTALVGTPATPSTVKMQEPSFPCPTNTELACLPISFIRSIRLHLATQSRLVNTSLLSEVLVQESLLDHFSALRGLLLLHDAHFARALTINLFTKFDAARDPSRLFIPAELNSILQKSVSESCWNSSPLADNLSFAITSTPTIHTHPTSILDCLELRYHVKWPHTLILDNAVLAMYSRLWTFLATLHHSIWAADDLFKHTMSLHRQDSEGRFTRCRQFHQVCLYRHQMHHFLLVVQAYVINQVHQISWSNFERKLREKVTSLDELYNLHSSLINSITSRCFLTANGAVVLKLVRDVFTLMLQFRTQFLAHPWQTNRETGMTEHPGFSALQNTHKEFQKHAAFLHKLLQQEEKQQEY